MTSTGTGKPYASAFAMRALGFKRVLFPVHRNQIAYEIHLQHAMEEYLLRLFHYYLIISLKINIKQESEHAV